MQRHRLIAWAGAVLAIVAGVLLYTRFSLDDNLRRDEAIYAYQGQQLVRGIPVYLSIFDPKAPLAGMLAGIGAGWAKLFGGDDIHAIRIVFLVFAVAAVGGIYALGLVLWRSPLAAFTGTVAFTAFRGFALDAIGGPDAKTPGIAFGVLAMVLLVRRRWFWGGILAGLAVLVWQPLVAYPLVAVLGALLIAEPRERRGALLRAVAGVAIPVAAMVGYFALAGALPQLVEAAVRFPLTGVQRPPETLGMRVGRIWIVSELGYGAVRWVLWGGLVAVAVLVLERAARLRFGVLRDPFAVVVVGSLIVLGLFTLSDFQGYPDLYPLLPYAAVGVTGAMAALLGAGTARRGMRVAAIGLAAVLIVGGLTGSWIWYTVARLRDTALVDQRRAAGNLVRLAGPGGRIYAIGDPTTLVLTHRRNPSRWIYLGSGVAEWMLARTPGGVAGWHQRIRAAHPNVVVLGGWSGPKAVQTAVWLSKKHATGRIGSWLVFATPATRDAAARRGAFLADAGIGVWPKPGP